MIGRLLIEDLRAGQLLLPEFLAQVEARFTQHEPSVRAFVPEEERFNRLYDEAEALILSYPDLIRRPLMFGALIGVKDIFHVEGFPTQAGSRLPQECGMHPLSKPRTPTTFELQERGRAFPPNFLHESWRDFLYWDTELDP